LWVAIAGAFVWFAPGASAQQAIAPAVASGLEVEDFLQTTYCLQFYPSCREDNPVLGPHPSTFHLAWYDGLWIASQWLVPKTIRPIWNFLSIGFSLEAVINNFFIKPDGLHRVGLRP